MQSDINQMIRPKPNSKTLGMRVKLRLYNFAGPSPKNKGIRKWLRNKAGEAPVLSSKFDKETNIALIENYLQNRGYFYGRAKGELKTDKKKRSSSSFEVTTGPQYIIDKVSFRRDSSEIAGDIDSEFKETLLKPGTPYNLSLIKAERVRIDRMLKERGYFYFKPDYILVIADSSPGDHKLDVYVRLKHRDIPPDAYKVYTINDVYVYANYRMRSGASDTVKADMVNQDGYYVIDKSKTFKPSVFSYAMVFEKGDKYSMDAQNASLSRLVNMSTFKFVKNRFEPVGDSLMNVYYYLTPSPRKSLRFEIGALTQNDNRAGTKASISWRNRNTFKGAEELVFKVNGGFEAQYSGQQQKPNIYNVGSELNLSFPRFVVPFVTIHSHSQFLPRTMMKLKYRYESESDLLRINSYTASYEYNWKEGPRKEHQLFPFNITYVNTDTLGSPDRLNFLFGNLIFDGIIIGPTYEFTYNSQVGPSRKHNYFFTGLVDLSGNIMGLAQKADYESNQKLFFGSRYAQYVKLQPDFRYYLKLSDAGMIATRVMAGIGIPYGNSKNLPNVKQFWAGGNSDLRGFPSRLAGPGTFNERYLYNTTKFIETLGDLKLEGNIELRQRVYKFLNVAAFADAGNIWLYRDNTNYPGGTFTSNFYKELAVDMGVGLRFDFKILVLRLDMGIPVRKPWLPEKERWVFDDISFGDTDWRRQNMILNIAIGYPF